jgi:hypothetical protein
MMGAGKSVPEHMLTYDISSMFEMGTGKVLSQEVAGATGKTIADAAITDATTGSFDSQFMNMSKTGVSGTVYETTHGKASGSVTPTIARPLSMDIPGLWLIYEEVSS